MSKKLYHILVIEDNLEHLTIFCDSLSFQSDIFLPLRGESVNEAKEIIAANIFTFDAILLDISLTNEEEILKLADMAGSNDNVPVIVLTGYANYSFQRKAPSFGISVYFLKNCLTPKLLQKSIVYAVERNRIKLTLDELEKQYTALFPINGQPVLVTDISTVDVSGLNNSPIANHSTQLYK
ncbi:hypothetical protein ACFQZS_09015 [Mucilaginibacter calamicampi]|uniref:Response regulatory domain-containing protein n=1 Tax=Mucilaginibacter calamicampi TaxID=1302352 RepID=A0ABW2YXH9_9SPHI